MTAWQNLGTGLLMSALVALNGCTTTVVTEAELPMSSTNRCVAPVGVSLRYNTLTIALGERPHAGYGIDLIGQQQQQGEYRLLFRERRPEPGRVYAQMLVSPCLQVVMPSHWQTVTVTRQDTGEVWQLTPADEDHRPLLPPQAH